MVSNDENRTGCTTAAAPLAISEVDDVTTQLAAVSTILNGLDALVYVADMQTHELLFINDYGKNIWGKEAEGKYCWQVLQSRDGVCEFCTNTLLLDDAGRPTGVHVWEFRNTRNGRWYQCRDQAIRWVDGRIVRMEIATDISDRKRLEQELEEARKRAETLSLTDELTGLHNRRAFFELAGKLFEQSRRAGRSMAVVMVDADGFKQINDRHGHLAGDEVLRGLACAIRDQVRAGDVLGRFGGEEFVLALPEADLPQAMEFAERLRKSIAATAHTLDHETLYCTVSIGVAAMTQESRSLEQLLGEADEALFRAKESGRDRVERGVGDTRE